MTTRPLYTTLLALVFVHGTETWAATCEGLDQSTQLAPFDRLSEALSEGCFDRDGWISEELARLAAMMTAETKTQESSDQRSLLVIGRVREEISQQAADRSGLTAEFFPILEQRAARAERALREGLTGESYLLSESWSLDTTQGWLGFEDGIQLQRWLAPCPANPADSAWEEHKCAVRYQVAKDVLARARLMERALADNNRLRLIGAWKANKDNLAKWESYFQDARSQFLWELMVNGCVLEARDDREEVDGVALGFRKVPQSQWILLHPEVAFEYVEEASDGSQLEASAVLEVVGWNGWWKWKGNEVGPGFGVSAIAAWTDRAGTDDLGWGLMLHVNHRWSLGVTERDSETGYLVSADLSRLWLKVDEHRKRWLRGN